VSALSHILAHPFVHFSKLQLMHFDKIVNAGYAPPGDIPIAHQIQPVLGTAKGSEMPQSPQN